MVGPGPGLDRVEPRGIGDEPFLPGNAGVIGNCPTVEIGHPALDQRPGGGVGADAGLGQQLGGGDAGLENIGLPELIGEG